MDVTEHGSEFFQIIREHFDIENNCILEAMDPITNKENLFKMGEGEGKSGSFFFFSYNRKFLIKTMTVEELHLFMKFLPSYCRQLQKGSLLAPIYGVFSVKLSGTIAIHILLMGNSLPHKENYVK